MKHLPVSTLVLAALAASPAWAQQSNKPAPAAAGSIDPAHMRVGDEGPLYDTNTLRTRVVRVVGASDMLIRPTRPYLGKVYTHDVFWVHGLPTKGVKDDQQVTLEGNFRVTSVKHYKDADGMSQRAFVLEPDGAETRKAWVERYPPPKVVKASDEDEQLDQEIERAKAKERKERRAKNDLTFAVDFLNSGNRAAGVRRLQEVVEKYPGTKAAAKAKDLLKELGE